MQHEILDLVIFNPTKIENIIEDFLIQNKIDNPKIYILLDANLLEECLFDGSHQQDDDINYEQICLNKKKEIYYRVGIKQALLFQYQLLFTKLNLNLLKISTDLISLINIQNLDSNILEYSIKDLTVNEFKNNIVNSINFDFEKYITNNNELVNLNKLEAIKSVGLFIKEI